MLIILMTLIVAAGLIALGIYGILETDFAREELRAELTEVLEKQFDREVRIGKIQGNPLFGLRIYDVQVSRWETFESGYVITVDSAYTHQSFDLADLWNLATSKRITFNSIEVFHPYIRIERDSTGKLTVDYMLANRPGWVKRLRPEAFPKLLAAGMPDSLVTKLRPLENQSFESAYFFLQAVQARIGEEQMRTYKKLLLTLAKKPRTHGYDKDMKLNINQIIVHQGTFDFVEVINPIYRIHGVDGEIRFELYPGGIRNIDIFRLRGQVEGLPIQIQSATGRVDVNDDLVKIRNLKLRTGGSRFRGQVVIAREDTYLDINLDAGEVSMAEIVPLFGNPGDITGTLAFDQGTIQGYPSNPHIQATFTLVDTGMLYGYEVEALQTDYELRDRVSYLRHTAGLLEDAAVTGDIIVDANVPDGPGYDFTLHVEHANAQRFFEGNPPDFESDLSGWVRLTGRGIPERWLELEGSVKLDRSRVRKLWATEAQADSIRLEVWNQIEYRVEAPLYRARTLDAEVWASGAIGTDPDACNLRFWGENVAWGQYMDLYGWHGYQGRVAGWGHLRGSILDPAIYGEFVLQAGATPSGQVTWDLAAGRCDIQNLFTFMDGNVSGSVYNLHLPARGVSIDTLTIRAAGNVTYANVPSLIAQGVHWAPFPNVRHQVIARVESHFTETEWTTWVDSLKILSQRPEERLLTIQNHTPLQVCVTYGEQIDLMPFEVGINGGRLSGSGQVFLQTDPALQADFQCSDFRLRQLRRLGRMVTDIPYRIEGDLDFSAHLAGTVAQPEFTIPDFQLSDVIFYLESFDLPIPDTRADTLHLNQVLGKFDYADRTFHIRQFSVQDPSVLLQARGYVPVDLAFLPVRDRFHQERQFEMDIEVINLLPTLFNVLSQEITIKQGYANGSILVGGYVGSPRYDGHIRLYDGAFEYHPFHQRFTNLTADFRFMGDRVILTKLEALWGGGRVRGNGEATLKNWLPDQLNFRARASQVEIHLPEYYLKGKVNVNARLIGTFWEPLVEGTTQVIEGVSYLPFGVVVGKEPYRITEPAESPIVIDMEVDLGQRFWLRNGQANIQLTTDPDIGAIGARLVNGEMFVRGGMMSVRGDYTFFGKQFFIDSGHFRFTNTSDLNPEIEMQGSILVRGRRRENDLTIRFQMTGTVLEPEITLYCDERALTEQDILTLLASNMTWEEFEETFGTDQFFSDEIRITAQGILESLLASEARKATQLDQFDLETRLFSDEDDERSVRVTVGKIFRVGEQDLFVSYSRDLLSSAEQRLKVDYIINRWLSLEGETDEKGEYNADVKLKFKY